VLHQLDLLTGEEVSVLRKEMAAARPVGLPDVPSHALPCAAHASVAATQDE
jgi:hypothetical protein